MLEEVVIPIDFGNGVDTKTDPKLVMPGKMLRLENGVFTNPHRISKRNGYVSLATTVEGGSVLSAPQMIASYEDELVCADQGKFYSYSPNRNTWYQRGNYVSTEVSRTSIDQYYPNSGCVDCAVFGNYAVYAWSTIALGTATFPNPYPSDVYAKVVDLTTGSILADSTKLGSLTSYGVANPVRCVLLSNSVLGVIYINDAGTDLKLRTVNFGASVTFSSEISLASDFSNNFFDVLSTNSGAVIAYYNSSSEVKIATINSSGSVVNSATISEANFNGPIFISKNSTNYWLYWGEATYSAGLATSGTLVYAVFDSSLTSVLAKTTLYSLPAYPYQCGNLITISNSTTQETVYFSIYKNTTSSDVYCTDASYSITATSAGSVGSVALFAYGVMPLSRQIQLSTIAGTNNYAVFVYRGAVIDPVNQILTPTQQPTYFLIQMSNVPSTGIPVVAARFGAEVANTQCILRNVVSYMPSITALSSSQILFPCGIKTQSFINDSLIGSSWGLVGAFSYTIDFASANSYIALNNSDLLVLNGGLMQAYDGRTCSELGFHVYPEISNLIEQTVTGGGLVSGDTYNYLVIFQWTDNQGNLHQSTISSSVSITIGGSNNAAKIYCSLPYLSQKTGVNVAVYRTTNAGSIFYLVTNPVFIESVDPSANYVFSYVDSISDSDLVKNPIAYTYDTSPILENSVTPPSMIMLSHNNRLWFVDSENPNTIWYSKTFSPGNGLSPSALMTEEIDPKYGNITALAEMDDKLVIFKQFGPVIQSGDGVDDSGSNSTLSFPQFVPSNVGCSQLKSVVSTPNGVMFMSKNGIYLFDRSLGVSYLGAPVEQYNSQTITSATIITGKSQIRFLVSSGHTLVYDYIFNQWSTFTNHTGLSATVFENNYVYVTTNNTIFEESDGYYLDDSDSIALLLQTGWLKFSSVQNFQRVRRLAMLGDFVNGASASHGLNVQAAYDFGTTFSTAVEFLFSNMSANGYFQYRERLPQQKCDAISLLITEAVTGDSAEFIDLSNISFEAAVKRGLNKLPAAQSVG